MTESAWIFRSPSDRWKGRSCFSRSQLLASLGQFLLRGLQCEIYGPSWRWEKLCKITLSVRRVWNLIETVTFPLPKPKKGYQTQVNEVFVVLLNHMKGRDCMAKWYISIRNKL